MKDNIEEQWRIILGLDKRAEYKVAPAPYKFKMTWWRRIGEQIAHWFIPHIWVPIRWWVLRRKGDGRRE